MITSDELKAERKAYAIVTEDITQPQGFDDEYDDESYARYREYLRAGHSEYESRLWSGYRSI